MTGILFLTVLIVLVYFNKQRIKLSQRSLGGYSLKRHLSLRRPFWKAASKDRSELLGPLASKLSNGIDCE